MSQYAKFHPFYRENSLIFEAAEAAKGFAGLADANQYFLTLCRREPEFVQVGSNVYRCADFFIQVGKRFLMAGHGNGLMQLAGLELSCLPQGIGVIWLENGEDMVLITRIRGSAGKRLIPCSDAVSALPRQARNKLLADVDRLLEKNYAVLAATDDKGSRYLLEGDDRVIFSACELAYVPDQAKKAYRNRVLNVLDLRE